MNIYISIIILLILIISINLLLKELKTFEVILNEEDINKYELVAGSVFKNELYILEDWIIHCLDQGIQHLYLINDNSTDNYLDIIDKYNNYITLIHNKISNEKDRQEKIYNTYLKPYLKTSKWFIIIDIDEFLYSPTSTIIDVLEKNERYSQIVVDWLSFGSNGHISQPKNVITGFTKRSVFNISDTNYSFKSIVKSDKLVDFRVHYHKVNGKTLHIHYDKHFDKIKHNMIENTDHVHYDSNPDLIINHYYTQSLDYYKNIKMKRKSVNNQKSDNKFLSLDYFNKNNKDQITDLTLFNKNKLKTKSVNNYLMIIYSCKKNLKRAESLYEDIKDMDVDILILYADTLIKDKYILKDSKYLIINCGDDYDHLVHKSFLLFNILNKISKYKGVFKCDDDIIFNIKEFEKIIYSDNLPEYFGKKAGYHSEWTYKYKNNSILLPACIYAGGPIYYVSKNCLKMFTDKNVLDFFEKLNINGGYPEDAYIGVFLSDFGIFLTYKKLYSDNINDVEYPCRHDSKREIIYQIK